MAAWHYDLFLVSTGPIDVAAMKVRLDRELPPLPSPSPKLHLWGSVEGDRIDFWTDHAPPQLLARLDLRSPSDSFRNSILNLAHELQLRMVNADDVEIAPTDTALLADIQSSTASEFVRNPPLDDDADDDEN